MTQIFVVGSEDATDVRPIINLIGWTEDEAVAERAAKALGKNGFYQALSSLEDIQTQEERN